MKTRLPGLVILALLAFPAHGSTRPVDFRAFIQSIQGTYRIDQVGGHTPSDENSTAEVFADTDEAVLTMPFCGSNGLCDPGYLNLGYPTTKVEREDPAPGRVIFTLTTSMAGKSQKYTWESVGNVITFTNYQYKLGNQITQLRHVLRKAQ